MTYLDGFSGYGGFHLGFEQAGWEFDEVYFSEIDKYAIANYQYNFPKSKYAGSITTISRESIPSIDLFTFGWPCQDNSIAGKRKGQTGGTRSGLLHEAVRIINEFKPRNFVAENVLGLLSVNKGIDIIESLKLLSYLNESCPQYDIEMQLLNTRWVLPQNRERVFFVGHLRGSGSRQVFPIGEEGFRNVSKGDTKKKDFACTLSTRTPRSRLSADGTIIKIKSATKQGFEIAEIGDSINTSFPDSETRRGRVGKGVAQTLQTNLNQCVLIENERFRDLTPVEYERLQGLPDNHTKYGVFNGEVKELSDTQRYRLCGNGVSVPIIKLIAEKLKPSNPTPPTK
jgi:DNA (cytosine-5)-methyltransferase 1